MLPGAVLPAEQRPRIGRLVIDDVPHRPYVDYQVLGADQYLEGDIGPSDLAVPTRAAGVATGSS